MPSTRPPLAVFACAVTLGAAVGGCSIALDFDRTYPTTARGYFPAGFLPRPESGEQPIREEGQYGACEAFCAAFVDCLADPEVCHGLAATTEETESLCDKPDSEPGEQKPQSRQYLRDVCKDGCIGAKSLTPSQLGAVIDDQDSCEDIAKRFVKSEVNAPLVQCDRIKTKCAKLCEDGGLLADCGDVFANVMIQYDCETFCEAQSVMFFECFACGQDERVCVDAAKCGREYGTRPDDRTKPSR
jgi:hypothetical protein